MHPSRKYKFHFICFLALCTRRWTKTAIRLEVHTVDSQNGYLFEFIMESWFWLFGKHLAIRRCCARHWAHHSQHFPIIQINQTHVLPAYILRNLNNKQKRSSIVVIVIAAQSGNFFVVFFCSFYIINFLLCFEPNQVKRKQKRKRKHF